MSGRRAGLLLIALFGVALLWAAVRSARGTGERPAAGVADADDSGEPATLQFFRNPKAAPTFSARALDGTDVTLASFRGHVVLINFWGNLVPALPEEIPDLVALQDKYRDRLQVIGISEDEGPVDAVKRFADAHHVNYPIVMATPEIEKLFPGIGALPTTFVIDRESRVVQKHVGMLTARRTEQETRALAGLPVSASIEEVDAAQPLKLAKGAQVRSIPGLDLTGVPASKHPELLEKLNAQSCTCGCELTVARCRVDDPTCDVSLPLARDIVKQITDQP